MLNSKLEDTMKICRMGYDLQKDGKPSHRCHMDNQPEFCKDCHKLEESYTMEEVWEAINNLKDWDNYEPFHEQVDQVLNMFTHMEKEN